MNATRDAVTIRGLEVRRGGNLVLPGISLSIRPGVVAGLLGPSGSGKSTLLRTIVGVQVVQAGEVQVLGLPAGTPALRRRVGYVTQVPSVYEDLTVRENLRYFARILDVPDGRIAATLTKLGLDGHAEQIVRTLSGGERSRVSLGVALLGEPELLVLDEPTVGLDPVLRGELWRAFHDLAAQGTTLLVSTHVMDEADRCDELMLMRNGRIVANAPPAALREQTGTTTIEEAFLALAKAES